MCFIDITQTYEKGMKKYESLADFNYEWIRHYSLGFNMALSKFTMASHLGTHIDSPYHFLKDGKKTKDIPLAKLCGEAQVIHILNKKVISKADLEMKNITCRKILIQTDNTELLRKEDPFSNVYLAKEACEYLNEMDVEFVGFDYFSVDEKGDKDRKSHMILLKNDVVILEGILLDGVKEGKYELYCLPLKFEDLEGAPCRAILKVV
ncbi:MAG: cyclase family protein [Eubacteriales bacterium]